MEKDCPLCKLEKLTKWYFESSEFIVIDCLTCHIPMSVARTHVHSISNELRKKMLDKCRELFGNNITIRWNMNQYPQHFHFHVKR